MVKIGAELPKLSPKKWVSVFLEHPVLRFEIASQTSLFLILKLFCGTLLFTGSPI